MARDLYEEMQRPQTNESRDLYAEFGNLFQPDFLERKDRKGISGVASDASEGIYDFLANAPQGVHDLFKGGGQFAAQATINPQRAAQNAAGGFMQFGQNIGNLPEAKDKYLQSRDLASPDTVSLSPLSLIESLMKAIPREPTAWGQNDTEIEKILKSIHLPRQGKFNYAENLGREGARFPEEAEADEFARQFIPQALSAGAGIPGLMANELGEERNPYGPLGIPGIKLAPKAIGKIKQLPIEMPSFLSKSKVGKEVGQKAVNLRNELGNMYQEVKDFSQAAGITANTPKLNRGQIARRLEGVDKSAQRAVYKAFQTGEISDLINAEKSLGQFKHAEWINDSKKLKAMDRNAYDSATRFEDLINQHIENALNKHNPALAQKLFTARNRYSTELGPYLDVPAIRDYVHGNLTEVDLVKALQSNTKSGKLFRAKLAEQHKNVGQNKFLNDLLTLGIGSSKLGAILKLVK